MFNMNISSSDRDVYSLVLALYLVYLPAHSVCKYNTIYMHRAMLFIVEKVPIILLPIYRKEYDDIALSSCLYYHNNQV